MEINKNDDDDTTWTTYNTKKLDGGTYIQQDDLISFLYFFKIRKVG
jgi:hypothetical protein